MKNKNYAIKKKDTKLPNKARCLSYQKKKKKKEEARCLSTSLLDWIICRKDKQWQSNRIP